ncbi:MAG: paraquat-inducible protein A [Tenuifilaceae bacterium]|uniref:paraquat-inducible protein A n=1 Tax=Perlabentimonas gracilis TaxID=2715279 RepID=UPI00140A5E52|nr:paraquat-inducible protein A [Perlabentimonas gracilis]MDX9770448.1 paraquat-inducible protein A [Tenuifilaceae bacterium]NHB68402.1 paraquat-inducible protein A [Perlabentimonas gracilis]
MKRIVPLTLWVASVGSYIMGLYMPLMVTRSQILGFTIKRQEVGLFDSIKLFCNGNELALAIVIFAFTIVLPIAKYIELLYRISVHTHTPSHYSRVLQALDKWSMLDVFVVALLIMNFKLNSSIIVMELMGGTTYLAISIVLRMGVSLSWDYLNRMGEHS